MLLQVPHLLLQVGFRLKQTHLCLAIATAFHLWALYTIPAGLEVLSLEVCRYLEGLAMTI
jgi:hypothetical protein